MDGWLAMDKTKNVTRRSLFCQLLSSSPSFGVICLTHLHRVCAFYHRPHRQFIFIVTDTFISSFLL